MPESMDNVQVVMDHEPTYRASPEDMVSVPQAASAMEGLGFQTITALHGATFKDNSTVVIVPTRGTLSWRVVQAHQNLMAPMNARRVVQWCVGEEVGHAYNRMIEGLLNHPEFSKWKYVLTLEDDNLPPPDAHLRLLESIDQGDFDAVSGLYFTKGDHWQMPMAYGDPALWQRDGKLTYEPVDVRVCIERGQVVEVNGIAMGCALWRMDLFRQIPPPWFVSAAEGIPDAGAGQMTQDLYFCRRARLAGKRFAVDCRVRVGHLDVATGKVY